MRIDIAYAMVGIITIFFTIFAYLINPPFEYDLYRHFEYLESLRGCSFKEVLIDGRKGYTLLCVLGWVLDTLNL